MAEPDVVQRCGMNYDMSTENQGAILDRSRGSLIGKHGGPDLDCDQPVGRESRNSFAEPDGWVTGPTGDIGGNDPCNRTGVNPSREQ